MVSGKFPGSFRYIFLLSAGWKPVLAWKYPSPSSGPLHGSEGETSRLAYVGGVAGGWWVATNGMAVA